jgi:hypothetical protein
MGMMSRAITISSVVEMRPMSDQFIKSRPVYQSLAVDSSGLRHLLVSDSPAFSFAALPGQEAEIWFVAAPDQEGRTRPPEAGGGRCFRSPRHLIDRLDHRLARERMGLRLYASGTEDFLWDVFNTAQRAGMNKQEIFQCHSGTKARRVACVHCRTFNHAVTTTIVRCEGCGANLFVRDHFSRRLSAFMGVKVDAEVAGDVPPAEQAYS